MKKLNLKIGVIASCLFVVMNPIESNAMHNMVNTIHTVFYSRFKIYKCNSKRSTKEKVITSLMWSICICTISFEDTISYRKLFSPYWSRFRSNTIWSKCYDSIRGYSAFIPSNTISSWRNNYAWG